MSTASNDNKAKLTNRDLWRVFLHQLTIRGPITMSVSRMQVLPKR